MTSYIDFYHYTSRSGRDGIIQSGHIRKNSADSRHAHFGPGTYGSSLPPSAGKDIIAIQNWTSKHGPNYIRSGSVDWAIKLKIPSTEVRRVGGSRCILVHNGPIYLKDYEWESQEVPGGNYYRGLNTDSDSDDDYFGGFGHVNCYDFDDYDDYDVYDFDYY